MGKDLNGQIANVTGGASGIGKAAAILYAAHGAKVVISDSHEEAGNKVVSTIKETGAEAIFIKTDVSQATECEQMLKNTIEAFGRLDICFNNAGIGGGANPLADMSIEGWNKIIAFNLRSVFYCLKYQIQQMLKQGSGAIVNNSSILGQVGFANSVGYVAAKHGVIGLTKNADLEYSGKGIRVKAVGPAFINTPLLTEAGIDDSVKQILVQSHPIERLGESEEVAELLIWLSSDKASFVTGSYYAIDGGYLAK